MSKSERYVDINIAEDIIEQTYHELLFNADKFREYSKEIQRKCEANDDCSEMKVLRIKRLLKRYHEKPEKYREDIVIQAIEKILDEEKE